MKSSCQRILIADTNHYFRHIVSHFLIECGNEVTEATTAREVRSLIYQRPDRYDLLIVADWLPDMDNAELFETLRSIPYAGRIVVATPELSPEKKTRYEALGAFSFLLTPVSYSDILRILEPPATVGAGENRAVQRCDATSGRAPDSSAA
jgi:CheY-like chemotaxis protein